MPRLNYYQARRILIACQIPASSDFDTLRGSQVECLLEEADRRRYRKPKNANGSRGRYFHAYVIRALERGE